jgi:hypothetical protein
MTAHSELPGTYRVADGSRAIFSDALATWVPLAYDELIATASKYHAVTTYLELSEHIQQVSGIRTRPLLTNWIGKLLEEVLSGSGERRTATDYAAPKTTADEPRWGHRVLRDRAPAAVLTEGRRRLSSRRRRAGTPESRIGPARTESRAGTGPPTSLPAVLTELPTSGCCDYCA